MADLGEQAIQVEWNGAKATMSALLSMVNRLLQGRNTVTHGQQNLKKLNLQGKQLENVEISDKDMKAFKQELNKYAVDFSVKKNIDTGTFTVFFKGQDIDRVYKGLEKCVANYQQKGQKKKPMKEAMAEAQEKAAAKNSEKSQSPERSAERGREGKTER